MKINRVGAAGSLFAGAGYLKAVKPLQALRTCKTIVSVILLGMLFMQTTFAAGNAAPVLSAISLSATGGAELSPPFSSGHRKYRVFVNSDVEHIVVNAIAEKPLTLMKINNSEVASGANYATKLAVGKNEIRLVLTNDEALSQEYVLTIVRENIQPIADAFLKGSYTDAETGETMSYRLFKPAAYSPTKSYPLVLFLHGSGEYGTDNQAQLMANQGAIIWAKPEEQAKHPCFVLAPQAATSWVEESVGPEHPVADIAMAVKVLKRVRDSYHVDGGRLYATGISDGGMGVWKLNETYPELFAAMVPVCGGGDPQQAYKLINKPIWAFHGEGDPVVPVNDTRAMVNALRELAARPLYTEYPRESYIYPMAHCSWVLAYQTPEMRNWLFNQVKKENL